MKIADQKFIPVQLFVDYDNAYGASGTIIDWDESAKAKSMFVSDN